MSRMMNSDTFNDLNNIAAAKKKHNIVFPNLIAFFYTKFGP